MAVDKLVDSAWLDSGLTQIATEIRAKGKTTGSLLFPNGFVIGIRSIKSSAYTNYQKFTGVRISSTSIGAIRFAPINVTFQPKYFEIVVDTSIDQRYSTLMLAKQMQEFKEGHILSSGGSMQHFDPTISCTMDGNSCTITVASSGITSIVNTTPTYEIFVYG